MDEVTSPITGQRLSEGRREAAWELRRRLTPAEAALWRSLRGSKLGGLHFRRQQIIADYVVDFYCHAARLVVEVDGPIHEEQREYDAARDEVLAANDFLILRVTKDQVLHALPTVHSQILEAASHRNHHTINPSPDKSPLPFREGAGG